MKSRIRTLRSASCFVTRASLATIIPNGCSMSRLGSYLPIATNKGQRRDAGRLPVPTGLFLSVRRLDSWRDGGSPCITPITRDLDESIDHRSDAVAARVSARGEPDPRLRSPRDRA